MPPSTSAAEQERDHREVGTRTTGRRRREVLVDRSRTRAGLGGVRGWARPIRTEARISSAALVVALAQSGRLAAEALELRCRVEADPPDAREPDLHPGMRGLERHVPPAGPLVFTGQVAVDDPRRDPQLAKDRGHRQREVRAESLLLGEEALRRRPVAADPDHVGLVREPPQPLLDEQRAVVGVVRVKPLDLTDEPLRLGPDEAVGHLEERVQLRPIAPWALPQVGGGQAVRQVG